MLLCLPLMAFTCVNIQKVSVLTEVKSGLTLDTLASDYSAVAMVVEEWAQKSGARSEECDQFRRVGSPGCRGYKYGYVHISVVFLPAERRTEIEFKEFGAGQSPESRAAETQLKAALHSRFPGRVREGILWQQ